MTTLELLLVSNRFNENEWKLENDKAFRKTVVINAEAGIEKMQAINFDIAVIDNNLSEEDGALLQTMFSLQQPDAKVIQSDYSDIAAVISALQETVREINANNRKSYSITDDVFRV